MYSFRSKCEKEPDPLRLLPMFLEIFTHSIYVCIHPKSQKKNTAYNYHQTKISFLVAFQHITIYGCISLRDMQKAGHQKTNNQYDRLVQRTNSLGDYCNLSGMGGSVLEVCFVLGYITPFKPWKKYRITLSHVFLVREKTGMNDTTKINHSNCTAVVVFLPVMFLEERKINCNCHTITHHWRGRESCFHKSTSVEPVEVLVDILDSAFIFFFLANPQQKNKPG